MSIGRSVCGQPTVTVVRVQHGDVRGYWRVGTRQRIDAGLLPVAHRRGATVCELILKHESTLWAVLCTLHADAAVCRDLIHALAGPPARNAGRAAGGLFTRPMGLPHQIVRDLELRVWVILVPNIVRYVLTIVQQNHAFFVARQDLACHTRWHDGDGLGLTHQRD